VVLLSLAVVLEDKVTAAGENAAVRAAMVDATTTKTTAWPIKQRGRFMARRVFLAAADFDIMTNAGRRWAKLLSLQRSARLFVRSFCDAGGSRAKCRCGRAQKELGPMPAGLPMMRTRTWSKSNASRP
jgi:hypothetical protein